jgi:uncharacterized phosphosugar-binding protein
MNSLISQYFQAVITQLQTVLEESGDAIYAAAEAVAEALANDKDYMLFGSGHSALIARDGTWRAGGLAPAIFIEDISGGAAERIEGMAALVVSNSGINPNPIEMAMVSKAAGLTVIAVTSLAHSQAVQSRHSSGKKLYQIADIVIDIHGISGDAALDIPHTTIKAGATSTAIGSAIIQAIGTQAAALLAERGITPPVLISANVPEGDAHNEKLRAKYRPRMVRYMIGQPVPVRGESDA